MGATSSGLFFILCRLGLSFWFLRVCFGLWLLLSGLYFGTTFCHLFLMQFSDLIPAPPEREYEPRCYGFRIAAQSPYYGGAASAAGSRKPAPSSMRVNARAPAQSPANRSHAMPSTAAPVPAPGGGVAAAAAPEGGVAAAAAPEGGVAADDQLGPHPAFGAVQQPPPPFFDDSHITNKKGFAGALSYLCIPKDKKGWDIDHHGVTRSYHRDQEGVWQVGQVGGGEVWRGRTATAVESCCGGGGRKS